MVTATDDKPNTKRLMELTVGDNLQQLYSLDNGIYPVLGGPEGWHGVSKKFVDEHRELIHAALDELPEAMQQAYTEDGTPKLHLLRAMLDPGVFETSYSGQARDLIANQVAMLCVVGFAVGRVIPVTPTFMLATGDPPLMHLRPRVTAFDIPEVTVARLGELQNNLVMQQHHVFTHLKACLDKRPDKKSHLELDYYPMLPDVWFWTPETPATN